MDCENCGATFRGDGRLCNHCDTVEKGTPTGIKLICAFGVLSVLVGGIQGILLLLGSSETSVILAGAISLAFALGLAYVLRGLWTVQKWAWSWALVLFGIDALLNLRRAIAGSVVGVVGVLISLSILGYIYGKRDLYASQ